MSYTRVKFEQTHIIRPASKGAFRRFSQTFRFEPFGQPLRIPLFGALVHYVILMQYTPKKPCCQAIFQIFAKINYFFFRFGTHGSVSVFCDFGVDFFILHVPVHNLLVQFVYPCSCVLKYYFYS